jgi:hypothetical protein
MGKDMFTGKHICIGLGLGKGCEGCKKKHPHLVPRSQEEIDQNVRRLRGAVEAYERVLDSSKSITDEVAEKLNSFLYGGDNANRFEIIDSPDPTQPVPANQGNMRNVTPKV